MADDKRKSAAPTPASARKKDAEPVTEDTGPPRPFDVKTVEHLVRVMTENKLTEIDLRDGAQRIRLCKGHAVGPVGPPPPPPDIDPIDDKKKPIKPSKTLLEIKSELIGTFYAKPKPDKDDYVKVGTRVTAETVICQIEAMKIFNEIKAGVSGVITEVCVKNGEPVEYNKVLFRVDPA